MSRRAFIATPRVSRITTGHGQSDLGVEVLFPRDPKPQHKFAEGDEVNVLLVSASDPVSIPPEDGNGPKPWPPEILHNKYNDPALAKAPYEEPGVWIRAKDMAAIPTLIEWCRIARSLGSPEQKVQNMEIIIAQIEEWQFNNKDLVKRPD